MNRPRTQKAQRLNHRVPGGDGGESNRPATNLPLGSVESNREVLPAIDLHIVPTPEWRNNHEPQTNFFNKLVRTYDYDGNLYFSPNNEIWFAHM